MKITAAIRAQVLSEMGKENGRRGGLARAKKLTKARRKEIASLAAKARWQKHRETVRTNG